VIATLKVGIASYEEMKARTLRMARGQESQRRLLCSGAEVNPGLLGYRVRPK